MKMQKSVIFVKKKCENKYLKDKTFCKVRDHCHYTSGYRGAAHSICNLKDSYSFIIKELAEEFKVNKLVYIT